MFREIDRRYVRSTRLIAAHWQQAPILGKLLEYPQVGDDGAPCVYVYAVKPKFRERGPTRKYLTTLFSRAKNLFSNSVTMR